MTGRPDDSAESDVPRDESHGPLQRLHRRRLLAAMAATGSASLSGCLSGSSIGPTVRAYGLANSLVFKGVEVAETFSFGGDRLTISVYLKPAAHERLGVKEVKVFAAGARPYSAADADTPPGPFSTGYNVPVQVPVDQPAIISAVNEAGTMVESINVTNDATAVFTWLGTDDRKITQTRIDQQQFPMPAKILTTSFEQRNTQFSTDAWMNAKVKNTARDSEIPHLAVEAVFTNDTGQVVDRSIESIGLSAGEVWNTVVPAFGDAGAATDGKLTITESHTGRPPVPPTNITVLEDSLEEPEDELAPPKVVGELQNTGTAELPFLEVSAKFYAENGDLFGENSGTVTGLNPGRTWPFEIPFYAHSTERAERVAEYELSLLS